MLGRLVLAVEEDGRDKAPQVEGRRTVGGSRVGVACHLAPQPRLLQGMLTGGGGGCGGCGRHTGPRMGRVGRVPLPGACVGMQRRISAWGMPKSGKKPKFPAGGQWGSRRRQTFG